MQGIPLDFAKPRRDPERVNEGHAVQMGRVAIALFPIFVRQIFAEAIAHAADGFD